MCKLKILTKLINFLLALLADNVKRRYTNFVCICIYETRIVYVSCRFVLWARNMDETKLSLPMVCSNNVAFVHRLRCNLPLTACMVPWTHPTQHPISILFGAAIFAHLTAKCPFTLHWPAHFPLKVASSHGASVPPSNTWLLRPARVHIANGISIGLAVFAALTIMRDRPTDRQTDHATRL